MAPSLTLTELLERNYRLSNVVSSPWCVRRPPTVKDAAHSGKPRLLLPLVDLSCDHRDNWNMIVCCDVLNMCPDATLTISTASRSGYSLKQIDRWVRVFRGRVTWEKAGSYEDQLLRYGRHDLTVIPVIQQTFAMTALSSAHMGTPFIAFNQAPVNEFSGSTRAMTGISLQIAEPGPEDYQRMINATAAVIGDSNIGTLHDNVMLYLSKRAEAFASAWAGIFFGREHE